MAPASIDISEFSLLSSSIPVALLHSSQEWCPRNFARSEDLERFNLKPEYTEQQQNAILRAARDYVKVMAAGRLGDWSRVILGRNKSKSSGSKGEGDKDGVDAEEERILNKRRVEMFEQLVRLVNNVEKMIDDA